MLQIKLPLFHKITIIHIHAPRLSSSPAFIRLTDNAAVLHNGAHLCMWSYVTSLVELLLLTCVVNIVI